MSARRPAAPDRAGSAQAKPDGGRTQADRTSAKPGAEQPAAGPLPTRVPASQQHRARPGQVRTGSTVISRAGQLAQDWASGAAQAQAPAGLSARLMALARMIQIGSARTGRNGFSKKLLADAEEVLARAGDRMRLSSSHTVVVLAGGTGSGKSSLFNRLAGADFSSVGVTRPVTMDVHACIWGATGSGALLDWLGVPARYRYSRSSALDRGEQDLSGLVLLDLPDHDSVMGHAGGLVDKLVSMADVMIWVLDPQKYADAAVHRRFLVPMAGHSDVLAVVLNQADLLDPAMADDCADDLRRLLDSENLADVPILVTSAVSGAGVDDLRKLLQEAVVARRSATVRIGADVQGVVTRFAPYAGNPSAQAAAVPDGSGDQLAGRFAAAAGVDAVSDSLRSAVELRAADFVGWPAAWVIQRLTGRDPMRKVRLGMLWNELRSVTAGPAGAQQAEIDNALTSFGAELADPVPDPWSHTIPAAVKSRADVIPAAIGAAIGEALPAEDTVAWWWRLAGLWQGLLLGVAVVAIVWFAVILIFGVLRLASPVPAPFRDTGALPWIGIGAIAALGLGAATSSASLSRVRKRAERDNAAIKADMKARLSAVASAMVIMPVSQELSEFERYREELRIAENGAGPAAEDEPAPEA